MQNERPEVSNTWRMTWVKIKISVKEACVKETKRIGRKETKRLKAVKSRRELMKRSIDAGNGSPSMISKYLELGKEERDARREAYTIFHSVEESAYAKGAAHDNGSASFFRRFTPRGAAHWINSIFNADWSDPSHPQRSGTHESSSSEIASAITPYYKSLRLLHALSVFLFHLLLGYGL